MSDGYMEQMASRRKRRRRIAWRVIVGAAVLGFVIWGPGWMIDRAHKSAVACSNADDDEAPNPKTDCTGGKTWLLLPKVVPWKRAAALKESQSIDLDAARRRLKMATLVVPNADEQARAIAELARFRADGSANFSADGFAAVLALDGVAWKLGPERSTLDSASAQNAYWRQTIQRGSIDDAISFARSPPALATEDYDARELFLRRGALLCLAGAEAEGRAAFHDAIRVNAKHHDFPFYEARIGLAACGEITVPKGDDVDRDALLSYQLGESLIGVALERLILGDDLGGPVLRGGSSSPFVAAAIAERDRPMASTLALVSARTGAAPDVLSPWPWEASYESTPLLVDPQSDERAAERLEALAKTAPVTAKPLDVDVVRALRMDLRVKERYEKASEAPAAAFRGAARGFWLEAASGRSRMGQCDQAEADGRRLLALGASSEERLYLAAAWIRCGHFDAAGEIASEEKGIPLLRALVFTAIRVQALAHAGKFDEALALAREAGQRSAAIQRPTDPVARVLDEGAPVAASIDWLLLALSLHEGDATAAPSIETPSIYERDKTNWRDLLAKPEADRVVMRWRMSDVDFQRWSAARPAEMFVIGKATDAGSEVWLDKIARNPLGRGILNMRARAEAARWRGDTKAEADWLARATSAEKLITNPKKLTLAKLAGL